MELTEPIESINSQLRDSFGIDTLSGLPIWRVVWSEDPLEKRRMEVTETGVTLLYPEVREVKKYFDFTKDRFILEQLVLVPETNAADLPTSRISYEPMWIFETDKFVYLPPRFDACQLIIDTVYAAKGKDTLNKYKDPEFGKDSQELLHMKRARVDKIQEELFGAESGLGGSIVHGEGVGYGVKK